MSLGFDEGSGTVAKDKSAKTNNGTIVGAKRTTGGKHGSALTFDGINDYVTVPDSASLDLTVGMTIEAWLYPTAGGSEWRQAVLKETRTGLAYGLYAFNDYGKPAGFMKIGSDIGSAGTSALPPNTWSHLATTYDGSALRTFVGGVQVSQRSVSGAITTSDRPLKIGGNAVWGEWFKGRIDNVRVYNRALTAAALKTAMGVSA